MTVKERRLASYQRQVQSLDRRLTRLQKRSDRFSNLRLLIVVIGFPFILAAYFIGGWALLGIALLGTIMSLTVAIQLHHRLTQWITTLRVWREIRQTHTARMRLDWAHIPATTIKAGAQHPFEIDLDLIDLHRLLNVAVSSGGSQRLHAWLLNLHPDVKTIADRQVVVKELITIPMFRDRLILNAKLAAEGLRQEGEGQRLLSWLQGVDRSIRPQLIGLGLLAGINIILFLLFMVNLLPPIWMITWLIYVGVYFWRLRNLREVFSEAYTAHSALQVLQAVFGYVEAYRYPSQPMLRELVKPVLTAQPSHRIRQLLWLMAGASLERNPILGPVVNLIVPWNLFFAERLEHWRIGLSQELPVWLEVWFNLEALSSLAAFAYLNPATTFPVIDENIVFSTQQIGHPLIRDQERVCNDFTFQQIGETVIITGSNMSGKSSFLRTLGVNLCLAYAGGTVLANRLETRLFRLFTCIRVTDSLQDGISYFYAEVRRLKALLDALQTDDPLPLFYLIDEIFRGTNNRERLIGSRAYIHELVGSNGVGLIATHDLELVQLAEGNPLIRNMHFREEIADGRMDFDYRLRSGPSPTTNALKIMALEGLPVEEI